MPVVEGIAPADLSPFVGRRAELAAANGVLQRVAAGGAGCVVVVGEPGIGKTRLMAELAAHAAAENALVLWGRASEFERDAPFAPFVDALDDHVRRAGRNPLADLLAQDRTELGAVLPGLAGGAPPTRTLGAERFRSYVAVRGLLGALGARRLLMLVLDDLHWADDASLELTTHLLRHPPDGRVLLALAYRPARTARMLHSAVALAQRDGVAQGLELGPLTAEETDELLGSALAPTVRRALHREAGGNPFYLEQLARSSRVGAGARSIDGEPSWGQVPKLVVAAIDDEVAALSDQGQGLLRAAAVVGDPFELELAVTIAGSEEAAAVAGFDELLAGGLIRASDTPDRSAFRHPIVRAAVYESAGDAWRRAAHARAARALSALGLPAIARAHHVEQSASSGDDSAVAVLAEAGADVASTAPASAARWYAAAVRVLGTRGDPGRRLGLLVSLAIALYAVGRTLQSREVLAEALDLVPREMAGERARILAHIARADHDLGLRLRSRALLEEALAEQTDPHTVTLLRLELALDRWRAHEWDGMASWATAAFDEARAANATVLAAEAAALLALAEHFGGRFDAVAAHVEESERLLADVADEGLAPRLEVLPWLGYANHLLERFERGIAHVERGIAIGRATGHDYYYIPLTGGMGMIELWLGQVEEAAERAEAAEEAAISLHDPPLKLVALTLKALTAHTQGRLQVAEQAVEQGLEAARRTPDAIFATFMHAAAGLVWIESGELERGRDELVRFGDGEDLSRLGGTIRHRFLLALALGELKAGRLEAAETWVERTERLAEALDLPGAEGSALWARAALILGRGEAERSAELAAVAAERFRSVPMPIEAARAEALAGSALAESGTIADAIATLERAHEALERCGAERYAGQVERELRRLGRRVPGGGRPKAASAGAKHSGVDALSGREREVAELAASGLSNPQIAERLFLSPRTVESHLSRAFRKLGISSRAGVARALDRP